MTVVSARRLVRTYGAGPGEVCVIRDVSFEVEANEFIAIVGPSGSGKSTLMNLLGLLDSPTSGAIYLEGLNAAEITDDARSRLRGSRIGFVFQSYNLLARSCALENVALPLAYAGVAPSERRKRAARALEDVGLGHRGQHLPAELSGGEQQRVAIARALVSDPPLILADEPTGALDSRNGGEVLGIFRKLHSQGRTVIMITHDPGIAAQSDRVIRLSDGMIIEDARISAGGGGAPS